jgi:hypothetical protein
MYYYTTLQSKQNTKMLVLNSIYKRGNIVSNTTPKNAVQNHTLIIANKSFENMIRFKYFGTTKEINRRLNMGDACYCSIQSLLSSHLLSKNLMIKMYRSIILPSALNECDIWFFILREE